MLEGLLGVIAFFATVLCLVIGGLILVIALLTHHRQRAIKTGRVLVIWLAVYTLLLLLASFTSQPRYIEAGKERCFDEMCYSTKVIATQATLGSGSNQVKANGMYTILTVQLRSDSKRSAQKPSQPDLFIVGAHGERVNQFFSAGSDTGLPIGQPITAAQLWDRKVQPGETVSRTVAFDLPGGIVQPGLVVSEGIGPLSAVIIGDENSIFHAKTEFLLTP